MSIMQNLSEIAKSRSRKNLLFRRLTPAMSLALVLIAVLPLEAGAHHDESFVDKLEQGKTERVSTSSSGKQGDGDSGGRLALQCGKWGYSASDNGRFVAFSSKAGNLHPADVNGQAIQDIFAYDRKTGKLDLVSALPSGLSPEPPTSVDLDVTPCAVASQSPAISGNGRYVAFVSNLPLTGSDHSGTRTPFNKVFVRDLKNHTTELVSRTWNGEPGDDESGLWGISISDNGRFVAFTSKATNMGKDACPFTEITPGAPSLRSFPCKLTYVRDRTKNETLLASKSSEGEPANYDSVDPSISGNGRYVVFVSAADNLVPDDHNVCRNPFGSAASGREPSCDDVFIHELRTGETELVSISRNGTSGDDRSFTDFDASGNYYQPISDNGRFVVFHSRATDLVPVWGRSFPLVSGIYARDRKTGRTERVSVSSTGTALFEAGTSLAISDNGRYVLTGIHDSEDGCPACDWSHESKAASYTIARPDSSTG